jgi:lysosomal acid lipase/cholesteryl ester hydrolase
VCHPKKAHNLGFVLADKGFDVWIVNVRGNQYGLEHHALKGDDFWKFTLDDIVLKDVPDIVDYIVDTTGHETVKCVALGYGCTILTAALSMSEELNYRVDTVYAFNPIFKLEGTLIRTYHR